MIKDPMTVAEVLALPASVPFPLACRALCIGRTRGYELAKAGKFPVRLIPVGHEKYKVPRTAILEALGIAELPSRQEPAA